MIRSSLSSARSRHYAPAGIAVIPAGNTRQIDGVASGTFSPARPGRVRAIVEAGAAFGGRRKNPHVIRMSILLSLERLIKIK
ncbi:hypothetical protein P3T23_002112 [Paraburkholderia sp. GAS448]|jgi:hypothetical protein